MNGFFQRVCALTLLLLALAVTAQALQDEEKNNALHFVGRYGGKSAGWVKYGNAVYLAQNNILRVLDLSDPRNPKEKGRLVLDLVIEGMEIKPPALYLQVNGFGEHHGGVELVNLSDPWKPTLDEGYGFEIGYHKRVNIALSGDHLEVAGCEFDVSDPLHPRRIREEEDSETPAPVPRATPPDKKLPETLSSIDIGDTENVIAKALTPWTGMAAPVAVKVSDRWAYVLDEKAGLNVLDVSDPAQPRLVGQYKPEIHPKCLAVTGHYVLLGDNSGTLSVIDVQNPASPVAVASLKLPVVISQIVVDEGKACLRLIPTESQPAAPSGLQFVNMANPLKPRLLGFLELNAQDCAAVAFQGDLAVLAGRELKVVDLTDFDKPSLLGSAPRPARPEVDLSDHGFDWNIDDPDQMNPFGAASSVYLVGETAVAMGPLVFHEAKDYTFGLINFFDLSESKAPVWRAAMSDDQYYGVTVTPELLVAQWRGSSTTNHTHGLSVFAMDEQGQGAKLGSSELFRAIVDVAVAGDWLYVADGEGGLAIFQLDRTAAAQIKKQEDAKTAQRNFARADAELNEVYQEVFARFANDPAAQTRLKQAQLAWLKYRDLAADFEARHRKPNAAPDANAVLARKADLTRERVTRLKRMMP